MTCHLPPIDALQEPIDSEIFKDEHNNMDCNFVLEDMFDLMQQPVMDSTVISESEFDSVLKCLTNNAQGVDADADADADVDTRVSLQSVKTEPSENEHSVTSIEKKIQCPCCPKEFISRLGFHKHYEKLHEPKLGSTEKKKILSNRMRCNLSEVEVKVLKMVNKAVHLCKLVITPPKMLVQMSR